MRRNKSRDFKHERFPMVMTFSSRPKKVENKWRIFQRIEPPKPYGLPHKNTYVHQTASQKIFIFPCWFLSPSRTLHTARGLNFSRLNTYSWEMLPSCVVVLCSKTRVQVVQERNGRRAKTSWRPPFSFLSPRPR